jgi:hypothetical protein
MRVENTTDLAKLRRMIAPLDADDERLTPDRVVSLLRNSSTVGRIVCATEALAWDAYRICAGVRYRNEFAADEAQPLALAA